MPEPEMHARQLEARVTRLEEGQAKLLGAVGRIESAVEGLASGQNVALERINRPWQWGVVVAAFVAVVSVAGVFATVLGLSISPLQEDMAHIRTDQHAFELRIQENEQYRTAVQRDLYWLEKTQDHNDMEIHNIWFDIKRHHPYHGEHPDSLLGGAEQSNTP